MVSKFMKDIVDNGLAIRSMFEEGRLLAAKFGEDKVYDLSLGNPIVAPPTSINESILRVLKEESPKRVHSYMSNVGFEDVRSCIANSLNTRFDTSFTSENIVMTVGAAGGLNVILKSILEPDDEVIVFAPFFGEYKHYVANFGAKLVVVPPNIENNFIPDLDSFSKLITKRTKAVIINSPNNPTGVVYSIDDILSLTKIMKNKEIELKKDIVLISDEPYREIVYDKIEVPFITKYYKNSVVCYSYSKSLSLAGERIGYLVIPSEISEFKTLFLAVSTATRILGFVNSPSLIQLALKYCLEDRVDLSLYRENRNMLMSFLSRLGFSFVKPEGAFYLFVKTPVCDKLFVEEAKKERLLLVPGSVFGVSNYVRLAYCVPNQIIKSSEEVFSKLSHLYGLS